MFTSILPCHSPNALPLFTSHTFNVLICSNIVIIPATPCCCPRSAGSVHPTTVWARPPTTDLDIIWVMPSHFWFGNTVHNQDCRKHGTLSRQPFYCPPPPRSCPFIAVWLGDNKKQSPPPLPADWTFWYKHQSKSGHFTPCQSAIVTSEEKLKHTCTHCVFCRPCLYAVYSSLKSGAGEDSG